MATGDATDTDTAAARLEALDRFFHEHPETGPTIRTGRPATPGAPLNLGMLDYIAQAVGEVVALTRAINPDAGPLPDHVAGAYEWCRANTPDADQAQAQRLRTLEVRHRLEHAVRAGDARVVRPMRCPACHTVGLHWQPQRHLALCINVHCARANNGKHQEWSLRRLAYEQVAAEKMLPECAT